MKRIVTTKGLVLFLFIAIVLSWCFSACSKNNENPEPRIKTVVHIVGAIEKENKVLANYWKDGVITNLNAGKDFVWANAVATDGKSIYVGGMTALSDAMYTPVYWAYLQN